MTSVLCCTSVTPYRPTYTDHEQQFNAFLSWTRSIGISSISGQPIPDGSVVFQLVTQINYGPVQSKRYFAGGGGGYKEVGEKDVIEANYMKVNTYKNFKCNSHNKFIEINMYKKDPVNKHHWRADVARPAGVIDL